jgi:hypothetical protein
MSRWPLPHRIARRLARAGCWLLERFAESSSQAAIAAAIVNASLTPPPANWICIALGLGQVLLPDGALRRRRARAGPLRTRRSAAGGRAHGKGERG